MAKARLVDRIASLHAVIAVFGDHVIASGAGEPVHGLRPRFRVSLSALEHRLLNRSKIRDLVRAYSLRAMALACLMLHFLKEI